MEDITMTQNQELLDKYDNIINVALVNIYTLSKEKEKIVLTNFDRKNKDHLLFLRVALLAKDIYNFPLSLDVNIIDSFVLNWKMRKLSRHVPRVSKEEREGLVIGQVVDVEGLAEFMYPFAKEFVDDKTFKFSHIYDEFYKGELG